jgi:hypothetical protein
MYAALPTPATRRWLRVAALACAPALAAACGDASTSPSDLAGTYALVSVAGQGLPYTTSDATYTYVTTDGTLYLGQDRTYRVEVNSRVVDRRTNYGQSVTDVGTGTYSLSGNQLTVYPDASSDPSLDQTTTGTASGSAVSIDVFTFARQ